MIAILTAYAFSLLGGFLRKESSPRAFTFVADLAVLLCITALADANGLGELLLFAGDIEARDFPGGAPAAPAIRRDARQGGRL